MYTPRILVGSVVALVSGMGLVRVSGEYVPPFGERLQPKPFKYEYGVQQKQGTFTKKEEQDERGNVIGEVVVPLPDGRIQTINYNADFYDGYLANVKYSGEPAYPEVPRHQFIPPPFIPVHLRHKEQSQQLRIQPKPQRQLPPRPIINSAPRPSFVNSFRPEFKNADIDLPTSSKRPESVISFDSGRLPALEEESRRPTLPVVTLPQSNFQAESDLTNEKLQLENTQSDEPSHFNIQQEALRMHSDLEKLNEETRTMFDTETKEPEEYQILAEIVRTSEVPVHNPNIMSIKSHVMEKPEEHVMSVMSHVLTPSEIESEHLPSLDSNTFPSEEERTVPFSEVESHRLAEDVLSNSIQSDHPMMSIMSHVIEPTIEDDSQSEIFETEESHSFEDSEFIPTTDHEMMKVKSRVIQQENEEGMMKVTSKVISRQPKALEDEN